MKQLLNTAINAALKAGKAISEIYHSRDFDIEIKGDNSPLTKADTASHNVIMSFLTKTNIPVLSEEGKKMSYDVRKDWKQLWIVDPIDGTKEFINRNGEFTVNISLIENNYPIFGIIYSPVKSLLYYAIKNNGSFKLKTNTNLSSLNNFSKININKEKSSTIKIIGSRSHSSKEFKIWIENRFTNFELITIGSSLKFCILAEGEADIYPRLGPTSEWDIAAGHIILEEAGGKLKTIDNKDILYNTKEDILNPHFIAYGNLSKVD